MAVAVAAAVSAVSEEVAEEEVSVDLVVEDSVEAEPVAAGRIYNSVPVDTTQGTIAL